MGKWMDGQADGWMSGCVVRRMDGWMLLVDA